MNITTKIVVVATLFATIAVLVSASQSQAQNTPPHRIPNKVAGMWKPVTVKATTNNKVTEPYGLHPDGLLTFGENMHFVEVITNPDVPRFASSTRQGGTGEEAKAAISGSLGLYGTYSVDEKGEFIGNKVTGSTFPNWNGSVRSHAHLTETVDGDTMTEVFHDGTTEVHIVWRRVQ